MSLSLSFQARHPGFPFSGSLSEDSATDSCSVGKQVQWPLEPATENVHREDPLTTGQCTGVWHRPVQADRVKQALVQVTSIKVV